MNEQPSIISKSYAIEMHVERSTKKRTFHRVPYYRLRKRESWLPKCVWIKIGHMYLVITNYVNMKYFYLLYKRKETTKYNTKYSYLLISQTYIPTRTHTWIYQNCLNYEHTYSFKYTEFRFKCISIIVEVDLKKKRCHVLCKYSFIIIIQFCVILKYISKQLILFKKRKIVYVVIFCCCGWIIIFKTFVQ